MCSVVWLLAHRPSPTAPNLLVLPTADAFMNHHLQAVGTSSRLGLVSASRDQLDRPGRYSRLQLGFENEHWRFFLSLPVNFPTMPG